jgi:hypothetical protein
MTGKMRLVVMSKIWKSNFAMKLCCPAYESDIPDPFRMAVCKAKHEQIRLQYREKVIDDGWRVKESEKSIENSVFKGRIDDVFVSKDGTVTAVDYVSSRFPQTYKLYDVAISAGYLRYELNMYASAMVVSQEEGIQLSDKYVEDTWRTAMSEDFLRILNLSDYERLEYANPASGVCTYCANRQCKYFQQKKWK